MDVNRLRRGGVWRGWAAATIAAAATLAVAGAAEAKDWKKGRYYAPYHGGPAYFVPPGHVRYYAPAPVYYAPAPVYYAPAPPPVVVYPAPVTYAPAYPAYGPPGGSVSLGINLPLR